MFLFVLTKENIGLAAAEAERMSDAARTSLEENYLLLDAKRVPKGLAFSKEVHELLAAFPRARALEDIAWSDFIECPYALRIHGDSPSNEREASAIVWRSLVAAGISPSVSLSAPKSEIHLFFLKDQLLIARLVSRSVEHFGERRAHLRPRNHPTSLHPKVARAMINLAGPPSRIRRILDPFCGSGGILIEAGVAGREVAGADLDTIQVERAQENLNHFAIKASIVVHDASKCDQLGRFDAIVTDLPLGRNAKLHDREETFGAFFEAAARAAPVLIVAADTDPRLHELFDARWRSLGSYDWYVHKGLTKRIHVLERK